MKRLLASLSCVLLFACSSDKNLAGASTVETENACIINVVNIDSKPAANVVARIRPLWYVEGVSSDSAVTQNNTRRNIRSRRRFTRQHRHGFHQLR